MRIGGSCAVVTGASSGIGAATARALGSAGARVALVARTALALEAIASEIGAAGGTALAFPTDLTDARAVEWTAAAITEALGTPDILVNSAGAGRWLAIEETSPEEAVAMMATPYFATFFTTRAFVPAMLRRGSGSIVVVNSPAALCPWPGSIAYAAARGAMRSFTEALRADLYRTGISVTSIIATQVSSNYWTNNPGATDRFPAIARIFPTLTPEQVAAAIIRSIERRSRETIIPRSAAIIAIANRLSPRMVFWLVANTGWRRPRQPSRGPR